MANVNAATPTLVCSRGTIHAIRSLDKGLIEVARSHGQGGWRYPTECC